VRVHADTPTRSFRLEIEGAGMFDEWTIAEVSRDLRDFSGAFSFSLRDATRSIATFDWASPPLLFRLRPGPAVKVFVDGALELAGWIETVNPVVEADYAEVTISGRDKAGDLIDCACAPHGPGEFTDIKLEDAVRRIADPFGVTVRTEIDTGAPIARYPLGVAETALGAIEKYARQKHALVLSDGTGGIVLTRTGATRAPGDLTLPGNMLSSSCVFSHANRHSETIVHGQPEKARHARDGRASPLVAGEAPVAPGARAAGDGTATDRERRGITHKGVATDPEIRRYRPKVHLSKAQPDDVSAHDEADWRMRTARAESEELQTTVWGYGVDGRPWRVNQLAFVDDAFQGIARDMVIARTDKSYDEDGRLTALTLNSPEAFDKAPVAGRRSNVQRSRKTGSGSGGTSQSGPLDGTARAL